MPQKKPKMETNDQPTDSLPEQVKFWLTESSEHDFYFIVGPESGPKERIGVVKTFLKGYSEVFRVMLGSGPLGSMDDISLTDVTPATFKTFLRCVYGLVDSTINALCLEEALDFLTFVDKYLISELKTKVLNRLARIDTFEEYCIIIQYLNPTILLSSNSFKKGFGNFTQDNATTILLSDVILQTQSDFFRFIVQNALKTSEASLVWDTILKKTRQESKTKDVKILRETLKKYIDLVKFDKMTPEDLCAKVFITGLLSEDEIASICCKQFAQFSYQAVKGKKDIYEISILYSVNNISSFSGSQSSNSLQLRDLFWSVKVKKIADPDPSLGVYLTCDSMDYLDTCNLLQLKISLLNQQGESDLCFKISQPTEFNKRRRSWGWKDFCIWEKLLDVSQGFVSDDKITLKAEFTVDYNV